MRTIHSHQGRRTFLKGVGSAAGLSAFCGLSAFAAVEAKRKDGFRPLFDDVSLNGWSRQIREAAFPGLGVWAVQDGVILGGQNKPGTGSYLVTDAMFADSEIELEARPDWRTDTGVYVRTNAQGNVGFQACIDYRPHGAIGGSYGNGLGGFHACDYCFRGKLDRDGRLLELIPEKPSEPLDATHHVPLDHRCRLRDSCATGTTAAGTTSASAAWATCRC